MNKQKTKTIKINFKYFWPEFNPENNLFTNLLRKKYNVIISGKPDFMFFGIFSPKSTIFQKLAVFLNKRIKTRAYYYYFTRPIKKMLLKIRRTPGIKGNFVKIYYSGDIINLDMSQCDWAFTFRHDEEVNHPRHMRLPNYILKGSAKKLIESKKIPLSEIKKEKTKFCNFLYFHHVPLRDEFFKKLNKYKKVDAPGKCMNNIPPLGNKKDCRDSRFSNNWYEEKLKFLKPYKFTIAFENTSYPGYVDEKIYQAMVANSIPIFWGDPLIHKDFNVKSFINVHNFKNMDEVIKRIIEIDQDDKLYEEMLKQPWLPNNKPTKWFDENRILKRLVEIVERGEVCE